jgi:CBS domain-containing protein
MNMDNWMDGLLSDENREEHGEDLLPLKVRDVMVREVITVDENSSVKEAVDIMNEFQIGSLIVLERGKAKGIVTERDFLRRVIAEAKDVMNTKVKEIMTTPLVVVEPSTDLEEAVKLMFRNKIKKLAVVDANKLVGIVTLTDIARFQPRMIEMLRQLAAKQETPKSMQKVIDYYIV